MGFVVVASGTGGARLFDKLCLILFPKLLNVFRNLIPPIFLFIVLFDKVFILFFESFIIIQ